MNAGEIKFVSLDDATTWFLMEVARLEGQLKEARRSDKSSRTTATKATNKLVASDGRALVRLQKAKVITDEAQKRAREAEKEARLWKARFEEYKRLLVHAQNKNRKREVHGYSTHHELLEAQRQRREALDFADARLKGMKAAQAELESLKRSILRQFR